MGEVICPHDPFRSPIDDVRDRLISVFHCSPVKAGYFATQVKSMHPISDVLHEAFIEYWNTAKLDAAVGFEDLSARQVARTLSSDGLRHPKFAGIQAFVILDSLCKRTRSVGEIRAELQDIENNSPTNPPMLEWIWSEKDG